MTGMPEFSVMFNHNLEICVNFGRVMLEGGSEEILVEKIVEIVGACHDMETG